MSSEIIASFNININIDGYSNGHTNGHSIDVILHSLSSITKENIGFNGQKIKHPFNTETSDEGKTYYIPEYLSPDAKDALENPIGIYVKWDGSCGLLRRITDKDGLTIGWTMFTRLDLSFKHGKIMVCGTPYDTIEPLLEFGMIPCESDPRIECPRGHHSKLHYPFMVPIAKYCNVTNKMDVINAIPGQDSNKNYKWNLVAFQNAINSNLLNTISDTTMQISVEQMGKQFNLKSEDIFPSLGLVPHNSMELIIPQELRTFDGMVSVLKAIPNIEGVIIYGHNNKILKFRRNMILDTTSNKILGWGKGIIRTDWAHRVAIL